MTLLSSFEIVVWMLLSWVIATLVHELGHYVVGRLLRMHITAFVIGKGNLAQVRIGKTWYCFGLPNTGAVYATDPDTARDDESGFRLHFGAVHFDERGGTDESSEIPRWFNRKAVLFIIGGPLANFLMTVVLLACSPKLHLKSEPLALFYFISILYGWNTMMPGNASCDGMKASLALHELFPSRSLRAIQLTIIGVVTSVSMLLIVMLN